MIGKNDRPNREKDMNNVYCLWVKWKKDIHRSWRVSLFCSETCREAFKLKYKEPDSEIDLGEEEIMDGSIYLATCLNCPNKLPHPSNKPWKVCYWNDVTGEESTHYITEKEARDMLNQATCFKYAYNEITGEFVGNGKTVPQGWADMRSLWGLSRPEDPNYRKL